ncbi:MAG: GFA family protein [Gammaproteobacteria bacterium]|nr:GFA family protein [Gammaproteobacteria bacterium]
MNWRYSVPNTRHSHTFCATCGSSLPARIMGGKVLQIPAGSLDNDPALKPNALVHRGGRACWVDLYRSANITLFNDLPPTA